jgi:hypothetical protein
MASFVCAGMTYLAAERIDETAGHAGEALALARRLGDGGNEAHALCLTGDIASRSDTEDTEGYYCQALAVAEPRGMRPRVAHCHLGLGKLRCRAGRHAQAQEHFSIATAMYREMGMIYWLEQAATEAGQLG